MKFGLIANVKRQGADEAINFFINWSRNSGNELYVCDQLKKELDNNLNYCARSEFVDKVDILVSMGGDGTMLASARAVGSAGTPILGINLGSLGFLTQLTPQQLVTSLDAIVKGEYSLEKRMLLQAEVDGIDLVESPFALNDVVIDNGPISRVIDIRLAVNKEEIVTYKADGLIISTPTGSTAYSLAAGGPILHPKMEAMIAAPISSFSLNTRPMIFSDEDILEISVLGGEHQAQITIDGQVTLPIKDSSKITIRKADFHTQFIIFPDSSFYRVLRNTLHWGYTPSER